MRAGDFVLVERRVTDCVAGLPCVECGAEIDAAGAAIVNDFGRAPHWQPFVEDLRSSPHELRHPECYARVSGVSALVLRVQEWHTQHRGEVFELLDKIDELKGRWGKE